MASFASDKERAAAGGYQPIARYAEAGVTTIAAGQSLSGVVDLHGLPIVALITPNPWTSAAITFQACEAEDGTFADVYGDDGNEVTIAAANIPAGAKRVIVNHAVLEKLAAVRYLKLRSGTGGVPVAQVGDRTIYVLMKG